MATNSGPAARGSTQDATGALDSTANATAATNNVVLDLTTTTATNNQDDAQNHEIEVIRKKRAADRSTDVRKHSQYQNAILMRLNNNYLSSVGDQNNATLTQQS